MKIHLVSHTHWDREWYRPFQYFKIKLSYFFDKLFDILEKDDNYAHFMLDGQMVMIEDYLNLEPQNKQKIKKYVEQGKLTIGPWYSQPDEFAPCGESLVRNLLVGTNMAGEYGEWMRVGYLPDSFGQSCQMPQILSGCGIKSACIMRGVPAHKLQRTEFVWIGLNGDEVYTVALPKGYSNGMFLPKENAAIDIRLKKIVDDIKKIGNKNNILILNGVDHQFPQPQISEYIKSKSKDTIKIVHSTLEDYIKDASKDKENLIKIQGELISPVTNRVHTSIASSRMHQKTKNRQMETMLTNRIEPICTLSYLMSAKYPQAIINSAWKEMFKNQAHDSICGCCTDEVHREIDQRFTDVENMGLTLSKMHSRAIAALVSDNKLALIVFNDSMIKGRQIVDAEVYTDNDVFALIDKDNNEIDYTVNSIEMIDAASLSIWSLYMETPCMVNKFNISFVMNFDFNYGYKKLTILEGQKPRKGTGYRRIEERKLENQFSVVIINPEGTFNLLDKQSGREYFNLNTIEDCADAGDTYNYSPVEKDRVITNIGVMDCDIEVVKHSNKSVASVSYVLNIPEELSSDGKSRSDIAIPLKIETKITVYDAIKRIDIVTKIVNKARDHRIRALFPTGIVSNFSYAETQYGTIKRSNIIEDAQIWKDQKWAEKPLPIYSNHKFVDVNDGNSGFAVLNRGLTEYEIYNTDSSCIAMTLLRSVGYMGKPDLAVRPGRPSGVEMETPDAQCLGEHIFEYSIFTHNSGVDEGKVAKHAAMYNATATTVQNEIRLTALQQKFGSMISLFDLERLQHCPQEKIELKDKSDYKLIDINDDRLIISALKKAENEEAIVIRVYNCTEKPVNSAVISINAEVKKAYECDLIENNVSEMTFINNNFETNEIPGYTAKTYKLIV